MKQLSLYSREPSLYSIFTIGLFSELVDMAPMIREHHMFNLPVADRIVERAVERLI